MVNLEEPDFCFVLESHHMRILDNSHFNNEKQREPIYFMMDLVESMDAYQVT